MSSARSRYSSDRRRLQAQLTRRDIVQAARRLFARHGYSRTSIAMIAREAGVAIQTIYSSVGSKRELLRRINDLVDEEGGVAELEEQISASEDPREMLRLTVRLTRQIAERCGDIIAAIDSAAASEPEMAEISQEGRRRHREGIRWVVEALANTGALRGDLQVEQAARIMAVLTYNETYSHLTRGFGMTFDEAEACVLSTLETLFLASSARQ